jgi:hypothetical protein
MTDWKIKGVAGAAWDATLRTLPDVGVISGQMVSGTLDDDAVTLQLSSTASLPDHEQRVEIYRDGSRLFRGWVTGIQISHSVSSSPTQIRTVTISGPQYWLAKRTLQSDRQAAGFAAPSKRSQIAINDTSSGTETFGYKTLQDAIRDFIFYQFNALETDTTKLMSFVDPIEGYALPRIVISSGSFLDALHAVLRWVPDATAWWRHDLEPCVLEVRRRALATCQTHADSDCIEIALRSRPDQRVTGISIEYAEILKTWADYGKPVYRIQASGTDATDRRVRVSGVEQEPTDTWTPPESADVTTTPADATLLIAQDGTLSSAGLTPSDLAGYSPQVALYDKQGSPIDSLGICLAATSPAEWWATARTRTGYGFPYTEGKALLTITAGPYLWPVLDGDESNPPHVTVINPPGSDFIYGTSELTAKQVAFFRLCTQTTKRVTQGWFTGTGRVQLQLDYSYYTYQSELPGVFGGVSYEGKIYRASNEQYAKPPSDLAANLLSAQNWLPWEGRIVVPGDYAPQWRGQFLGIFAGDGSARVPAEWETAKFPVSRVTTSIGPGGNCTLDIGLPPRLRIYRAVNLVGSDIQANKDPKSAS